MEIVSALFTEVFALFKYSTKHHLGADEVYEDPSFKTLCQCSTSGQYLRNGSTQQRFVDSSGGDCSACILNGKAGYHAFINRMHRFITSQGRQTIVWEGFDPHPALLGQQDAVETVDKDVLVSPFDVAHHDGWDRTPIDYFTANYSLINSAWAPLYVCPGGAMTSSEDVSAVLLSLDFMYSCTIIVFVRTNSSANQAVKSRSVCASLKLSHLLPRDSHGAGNVVQLVLWDPTLFGGPNAPTPPAGWQRLPSDNWWRMSTQAWAGSFDAWPINSAHPARGGQPPLPIPAQIYGAEMCAWQISEACLAPLLFARDCSTKGCAGQGRPAPRVAIVAERSWGSSQSPEDLLERIGCGYS